MRPRSLPLILVVAVIAVGSIGARTYRASSPNADEQAIRKIYDEFSAAIKAKDLNRVMAMYTKDEHAVYFDAFVPRQYVGYTAYRKDYANFFKLFPGPSSSTISDLRVTASGTLAYASSIDRWTVTGTDKKAVTMIFRSTDVFRKVNGKWLVIHEHLSFPVDPVTGDVDLMSKP